ncbi:hypothetical protein MES5069_1480003 [Mesorhizobium escarrei]|uniref:Uncharacterized protein n=1 Tax=Mesorhizobium escarrei TaxID=666018 RepID=A0ABN8JHH4_9HYPH|nr:hypothetical protein MES5069_1480003 [Mesorhizobium escarrei]
MRPSKPTTWRRMTAFCMAESRCGGSRRRKTSRAGNCCSGPSNSTRNSLPPNPKPTFINPFCYPIADIRGNQH